MAEPFCAVVHELNGMIASLYLLLRASARMEDPATDPVVTDMTRLWTETVQGRSLLEALALLFVGVVALKAEWQDAMRESDGENFLAYATFPEIKVN